MKMKKVLILPLLACTLLTGCNDSSSLVNGDKPVGTVNNSGTSGNGLDTNLTLQDLYDSLKASNGGSKVVEKIIEKIASIEYSDEELAKNSETFTVKDYHTTESLKEEITEKFKKIVEGTSYNDDDGKFDPEAYKEYVEETLDYKVTEGKTSSTYINDSEVIEKLKYNYDEYIKEAVKPDILKSYIYLDYVTSASKYKGQFSNQYAVRLEVLKIEHDTTKINGAWNEALIRDVKAMTSNKKDVTFGTNYSFATFNSDNNLIVFTTTSSKLSYDVYTVSEDDVKKYVPSYKDGTSAVDGKIAQLDVAKDSDTIKALAKEDAKIADESWTIEPTTTVGQEYYEHIEDVLIARKLWQIDREVSLAKNYDFKTPYYQSMTETEKSEAQGFSSTYSNSNSKPITEVAKSKKISAQKVKYYTEPDYYTKSTYSSVLPSALSSLRGTSAKDLRSHLRDFGGIDYLLPTEDSIADPVYLDTSSDNYYICSVPHKTDYDGWYGLYISKDKTYLDSSAATKQMSNYHIEMYQAGILKLYTDDADSKTSFTESQFNYYDHKDMFEPIIKLVQVSAQNILTDAIRKEAIVSLFEKYSLEINDQDIYDYVSGQYPDYFEDKD